MGVSAEALSVALRHGSRLVDLTGAVSSRPLSATCNGIPGVRTFSRRFYPHLGRRSGRSRLGHRLRGEAPGVREGGVVDQLIHDVEISCPAGSIPEKLQVNINHLKSKTRSLWLNCKYPRAPNYWSRTWRPSSCNASCRRNCPKKGRPRPGPGEPEVIGAKKEEEGEEKEEK